MSAGDQVRPLVGNQLSAVAPDETVWLSASAGTGKTQVLSSRVLRLLLQDDVEPAQILCLTFTKAGATEMAERIGQTLARWVRADPASLGKELDAIGADTGPVTRARARTLFAKVLDCPGGGLRIDTIHAFAQWLLAAFPTEAGLVPGTRPMEDRDRDLLARQVLADLLVDAEERGDARLLDALAGLTLRMAPEDVEAWLLRCAAARDLWFGTGSWQTPFQGRLNVTLGLPREVDQNYLDALCADATFDVAALRRCLEVNRAWKAAGGQQTADAIDHWLSLSPGERLAGFESLADLFLTKAGKPRSTTSLEKIDPDYPRQCSAVLQFIATVREQVALVDLAQWLGPALELGRAFALAWHEAKAREGLIDFDDQIREAADLLDRSDLSDWIRYKLDRRFDHILIDEAQDTNAAQWRIINALTGDFFAGEGAHGDKLRTLFVVGDYKQAIFRFQGTSPKNFEEARERVAAEMRGAAENAALLRGNRAPRALQKLGLGHSFRTAQVVLDFVDRAIAAIGHEGFGLAEPPERHVGAERPGQVVLWRPVSAHADADDEETEAVDAGEEAWLSRPDRDLAERIALQVKEWVDPHGPGFGLAKGGLRRAGPDDVMVLVRKRKELAGLIVARLHAAGVAVAGVDRLRLGAPLAVKDLVAALRFAAQPLDDLNLAALLVSPLVGWTQEQLLEHGYRDKGVALWPHLRRSSHPEVAALRERLGELLARADYEPPQALLHWLLVGPWRGREKLVARLGREANDPLDELLNAAGAHAAAHVPSLAGFLAWFDAGEGELKREADGAGGQVRVMTVHGSKGLQAPIVILADATGNPASARGTPIELDEPGGTARTVPLPGLRKEERVGRIREAQLAAAREEDEEHWRLLYVAMTRAEEALFVGGALGLREKEPAPESWYARLAELFAPERRCDDPIWGWRAEHGQAAPVPPRAAESLHLPLPPPLPVWLTTPVAAEPRPPRPLAPSSLGEDEAPDPPLPPGTGRQAARRGVLIHKLLERLPTVPAERRREAASGWLARNAPDLDAVEQAEMAEAALAVLTEPTWADLFGPAALAEAGIAAVVGGQVVAGTIDRLLIGPECVRLVDFKTTRRPPDELRAVPTTTLRQMAAYAAALEVTYPGRAVTVAVLYTHGPALIELPPELLARHKPALAPPE
jgi:ATP-dependent helicase/nuclease subunit A